MLDSIPSLQTKTLWRRQIFMEETHTLEACTRRGTGRRGRRGRRRRLSKRERRRWGATRTRDTVGSRALRGEDSSVTTAGSSAVPKQGFTGTRAHGYAPARAGGCEISSTIPSMPVSSADSQLVSERRMGLDGAARGTPGGQHAAQQQGGMQGGPRTMREGEALRCGVVARWPAGAGLAFIRSRVACCSTAAVE